MTYNWYSATPLPDLAGANTFLSQAAVKIYRTMRYQQNSSIFPLPANPEFGFDTHVRNLCQLLRKFGALFCLNRRREPRNRQLLP